MFNEYEEFLTKKAYKIENVGFDIAVKHLAQANEEGLRDPTVPNDLPEKKAVKPRKSKATAVAPPLAVSEPSVVAVAAAAMETSST